MRQARSFIGAATGLAVLAGGMAIIDERVRYSLKSMLEGHGATGEIAGATSTLQDVVGTVLLAIRDQSIEHAPLTLFAVGAMVLVLFMTRA